MNDDFRYPTRPELLQQIGQQLLDTWDERDPAKAVESTLLKLLQQIKENIFPIIDITISTLIYDEKQGQMQVEAVIGPLADHVRGHPPRRDGTAWFVCETLQSVIVDDVARWPRDVPGLQPSVHSLESVCSYAMLPLIVGEGDSALAIGAVGIASPEKHVFDPEVRRSLEFMAVQAAVVVQNARVHRRRLREEQAISQISLAAAQQDPLWVSTAIARQAVSLTNSAYAVVFLASHDRRTLESKSVAVGHGQARPEQHISLPLSETSINGRVMETKSNYYAPDLVNNEHYLYFDAWDKDTQSAYCVPLDARGTIIGTLYVASENLDGISPGDQDFIDKLAHHAAMVLRSARMMDAVARFQQAISDVLPIDEQFTQIREQLRALSFDVSGLFIATYDHQTHEIRFPKVRDRDQVVAEADGRRRAGGLYAPRFIHEKRGLVEWVIGIEKSLLVQDFATAEVAGQLDPSEREGVISCVVVPMYRHNRVVGAVGLRSYDRPNGFSEYAQQFLEVVANHIAITIENAETYAEEVRQQDFRQKIAQFQEHIVDTLPLPAQVEQIRIELNRLAINTDGLFIAVVDEDTGMIDLPSVYEQGRLIPTEDKLPATTHGPRLLGERSGLIDWVIQHETGTLLVEDFEQWPLRNQIDPAYRQDLKCFLATPMMQGERLVGVIGLRGYEAPSMFDESHKDLLRELADYMAIVVQNAQKLSDTMSQLQQQIDQLQALSDFQSAIGDIEEEEQEVLDVCQAAHDALGRVGIETNNLFVALYRPDADLIEFPLVYEHGLPIGIDPDDPDSAYRTRKLGERGDLAEWVIRHREPLLIRNKGDAEFVENYYQDIGVMPARSQSWLGAPMVSNGRVIGMMGLRSFSREDAYDDNHQSFFCAIASHAAIALANSRLLESELSQAEQARALAQAAKMIAGAGLDRKAVLQAILERAVTVTGARYGTLHLTGDEGDLELAEIWPTDLYSELEKITGRVSFDDSGVIARTARLNDAQLVPDVSLDTDFVRGLPETRSELAVPLRRDGMESGGVVGVLNVEHAELGGLDHRDRLLLTGLANLAVVAIQNAEQYLELEEAREYASASEAIAWLGILGAEQQHTLAQKVSSIRYAVDTLSVWAERNRIEGDSIFGGAVDDVLQVADNIQNMGKIDLSDVYLNDAQTSDVDSDLGRMVRAWCQSHNREHSKSISLALKMNGQGVKVRIPPRMLRIAMEKLVDNALNAMSVRGRLTIETQCVGANVQIAVKDSGSGIPPDIQSGFLRQIIRHSQGSGRSGTGSGAFIARSALRLFQGEVYLVETGVSGTTLHLVVPIAKTQESP